jgi:site-specific DNA-methyltransferase (adenine-specific)
MTKLSDERSTPDNLFKPLDKLFNFDLDPCATKDNAKCERFFTIDDDGLNQSWSNNQVFMNPPYSRGEIAKWIHKTYLEKDAFTLGILPGDTSTKAAQLVWETADIVFFPKGRFKFSEAKTGAKFATMIVLWHTYNSVLYPDYTYYNIIVLLEKAFKGKGFIIN